MPYFFTQCKFTKAGDLTASVFTLALSETEAKQKAESYFRQQQTPAGIEMFGDVANVIALPVTPMQQKFIDDHNQQKRHDQKPS